MRVYDYSTAKSAALAAGLEWSDAVADQVDAEFVGMDLSQAQVDRLLFLHGYYLKWAIDPKRLTLMQRIKAALYFLKG